MCEREHLTHAFTNRERERETEMGLMVTLKKVKPYLAMVSLQFGYAGMYIISLVSLKRGMSHYVLSVYRHVVATVLIAPFAIVLERCVLLSLSLTLVHVLLY